jgi:hypothetical protein
MDFCGQQRLWHEQNTDARSFHWGERHRNWLRAIFDLLNELKMPVIILDFVPEDAYLTFRLWVVRLNIVESHDSTAAHQWSVHFKVLLDSGISVIGVDK